MDTGEPRVNRVVVHGPIARDELAGLAARVCGELGAAGSTVVECDVATVEPDAVTVDALARLQLGARRHGRTVRLVNGSAELAELVRFMGLEDVL